MLAYKRLSRIGSIIEDAPGENSEIQGGDDARCNGQCCRRWNAGNWDIRLRLTHIHHDDNSQVVIRTQRIHPRLTAYDAEAREEDRHEQQWHAGAHGQADTDHRNAADEEVRKHKPRELDALRQDSDSALGKMNSFSRLRRGA